MDPIARPPDDALPPPAPAPDAPAEPVPYAPADTAPADVPARGLGFGEVLRMSIPTSMTMINTTIMQFVDGLMVARISPGGAEALSAQATAGITHFTSMSLMFGILSVVNTYVAQNLGARRLERCSQYTWMGLYLAVASAAVLVPLLAAAPLLFGLSDHAPDVRAMEVTYFRYLIGGSLLFLGSHVLQQFFFGTHRPGIVFLVSLVANAVNIVGDYALIFGKWGLPRMGLRGAAIATLVGAGVGLALLAVKFLFGRDRHLYDTRRQWRPRGPQAVEILRIGVPAGLQWTMDVIGWTIFIAVLVGGIGTVQGTPRPDAKTIHLAATSVAWRYLHVSFMPAVGISIAVTALVGRYIGAGRVDVVMRRVLAALLLAMAYMGTCGLAFLVFRHELVAMFIPAPAGADAAELARHAMILRIGGNVMILAAVFQIFDAVGITISGALRGAGDTVWPAVAMATANVTLLVGGGLLMLRVFPQLESVGVWVAGTVYVIAVSLLMAVRFLAGTWKRINLLDTAAA